MEAEATLLQDVSTVARPTTATEDKAGASDGGPRRGSKARKPNARFDSRAWVRG